MIELDGRSLDILSILTSSSGGVTIQELSRQLAVSARTVRYDLEKIDAFLQANALPPLHRDHMGVSLAEDKVGNRQLWDLVSTVLAKSYIPNQNERVHRIQLELLYTDDYLTMEEMSQMLGVSRSTIVNDMKIVKSDFEQAGIMLESKPRYGFQLSAPERRLRAKLVAIMLEILPANEFISYMRDKQKPCHRSITKIRCLKVFKSLDLAEIFRVTQRLEEKLGVLWSDQSFTRIAYTIAACFLRKKNKHRINFSLEQLNMIENSRDHGLVCKVLTADSTRSNREFSRKEIAFITLMILCADTNNITYYKKENQIRIQIIAGKIIKEVSEKVGFDFTRNDDLPSILSEYLSHAYYRVKFSVPGDSKVYQEISHQYGKIVQAVKASLDQFQDLTGHRIPPDEAVGIATVFCGEYYVSTEKTRRYRILVISDEGLVATNYLTSKLTDAFPEIDIMAVASKHRVISNNIVERADFIVTTVPLASYEEKTVVVSPTLNQDSIEAIKRFIFSNPPKNLGSRSHNKDVLTKVLSLAGKICPKPVYDELLAKLAEELGPLDIRYYDQRCGVMLKHVLTADTISLKAVANTWDEAVRLCGELMVKADCVEPRFVDAMIEFVLTNGPYVVLAPGIAIPHARPEDGVKKMCMSLVTLATPVEFGNEDNDPVDLVIGLAAIDNSSHLDALAELIAILGDERKREIIRNAVSPQEILALVS